MAATSTEKENSITKTVIWTLYDKYQATLSSPSEEKSSKGKKFSTRLFSTSSKGKKQEESTPAPPPPPPPPPAVDSSIVGDPNPGEGSSSLGKKKIVKTYSYPPGVRGFMKDEMSLEIMLLQGGLGGSIKTIGVVGLPAVGKTTLCKFILKNDKVKSKYTQIIWINLSEMVPEETNTDDISSKKQETEDIMEEETRDTSEDIMELNSNAEDLSMDLAELNHKLNENKYLIVIDDVGESEEGVYYDKLRKVINELPKEKGGAVIVTCRSEEAAKKVVGDNKLHHLQPLNHASNCWWIYNEAVDGKEIAEDKVMKVSKEVKEELMKRCGGLPGAARMLGQIKAQQLRQEKQKANPK